MLNRGTKEKDVETVIVRGRVELEEAIENKKKIRFDLEIFTRLYLSNYSKHVTVSKLLDIIINDDHVPVLEFAPHDWSSKDLKTLTSILTETKAITRIDLSTPQNAVKTIFQALEANTSVKVIGLMAAPEAKPRTKQKFYEKLCEGLISKKINVETFEFIHFTNTLTMEYLDQLFDALKSAKSIRSLIFNDCLAIFEDKMDKIGEILLENKRIKSLIIDTYFMPPQTIPVFIKIINDNNITQLQLKEFEGRQARTDLTKAFSENTSITDLDIGGMDIDPMELEKILINNRTILKLNYRAKIILDTPVAHTIVDALEKNTSLTELSGQETAGIEKALLTNKTLRSFRIADTHNCINGDLVKRILQQNTTLTTLDIKKYRAQNKDMDLIIQGLAYNTTLQSFACQIETQNEITRKNFCAVISSHQSLTHLETQDTSNLSILRMVLPGFAEMVEETLQANLSLRSWSPYDTFDAYKPYFKRNIEVQDNHIRRTKTIIRMICLKPHSFVLPIEIWALIFSHVRYPGVNMDFCSLFHH